MRTPPALRELPRAEIRPAQGLADRALVRLEVARPLEGHDRRVRARVGEQPAPFLECVVSGGFHVSSFSRRSRSVCENLNERPALVTKANRPVPEFLPFRGIRYALGEESPPADVGPVARHLTT